MSYWNENARGSRRGRGRSFRYVVERRKTIRNNTYIRVGLFAITRGRSTGSMRRGPTGRVVTSNFVLRTRARAEGRRGRCSRTVSRDTVPLRTPLKVFQNKTVSACWRTKCRRQSACRPRYRRWRPRGDVISREKWREKKTRAAFYNRRFGRR